MQWRTCWLFMLLDFGRYAVVQRDSDVLATANVPAQLSVNMHGNLPRTAAYWAAVASEAAKEVCPTVCQSLPSGSTGLWVPVTSEGAASTQLTLAENIDRELLLELGAANNNKQNLLVAAPNDLVQAHCTAPSHFQVQPFDGPVHMPSSSLTAGYWTSVAFVDPKQMYSDPYQWQPSHALVWEQKMFSSPQQKLDQQRIHTQAPYMITTTIIQLL
ncbi:hypothetical protein Acr_03g0019190 [Actinidia rufa]|uniref:Uncharacterized protein n=1 Tax=Actinidia rufa TaxID=165716 RepID=A0A7J0EFB1_9ERIC|nr:hypothetical protein Acr_03g0019190 [Actinidia rufa]